MTRMSVEQIAERVAGRVVGDAAAVIEGVNDLEAAQRGEITFVRDAKYAGGWVASQATAALCGPDVALEPGGGRALLFVDDPDLALATVLELFAPPAPRPQPGVHTAAVVHPTAELGEGVAIGPGCVVGPRVRLGAGCVLHANVTILDDSTLGDGCELWPGVVVRERCHLGDRVILHPNSSIGADGFGYRPDPATGRLVKMPHIGTVELGDDVEIGAGSCVDRGKFGATVVGAGTKIDNLCQIAHNCRIGRSCVIAGEVGLAGSVTVGDGVQMGGKVAVKDHARIGDRSRIAACAAVLDDVPAGATVAGYPARDAGQALREHAAMRKLPELVRQMRKRGESERRG